MGYSLRELSKVTGCSASTIRSYMQHKLVPRAEFRGGKTEYTEDARIRVSAVSALAKRGILLRDMRPLMRGKTLDQLRAIGGIADPSAASQPQTQSQTQSQAQGKTAPKGNLPADVKKELGGDAWLRLSLWPWLELSIRADAPDIAFVVAKAVAAQFREQVEAPPPAPEPKEKSQKRRGS
jgi:DNA-binding transcriptional MerR regulator